MLPWSIFLSFVVFKFVLHIAPTNRLSIVVINQTDSIGMPECQSGKESRTRRGLWDNSRKEEFVLAHGFSSSM
jgi:hypothetical protein